MKMIASSFLSGLLGAMGFGGGTVLVIYLTSFMLVEQKEAQGINLVFFLFTGICGLIGNIKNGFVEKTSLKNLIKTAIPGMALGFILLPVVPSRLLKKFLGGALLLLGLKNLFEKKTPGARKKDTH